MNLLNPYESYLCFHALWTHHRNLRLPRTELLAAQRTKFRRLVHFARERSPYYRDVIAGRGLDPDRCEPTDFPVLTKRDVIRHFDHIVTDRRLTSDRVAEFLARSASPLALLDGRYHVLHTSGTSGTMGMYVFSKEAWIRATTQILRAVPFGLRRRVAFVAATQGHFAGVSLALTAKEGSNRLFSDVRTFDVGRPLPEIVRGLNDYQPHSLGGYAAALKVLAEAQERGDLHIRPDHLSNGGEPLLPTIKAYVERVFKAPIVNVYASSEHLIMGLTLPGTNGLHLLEDDLIFELHEDHTCVTNLFNETMPLIRYRMDDVLQPEVNEAPRYPFTRVKEVVGRYEDALVFTNRHGRDDFIHPIVIVELIVPGLDAWQVVLVDKTTFRFRARYEARVTVEQRAGVRERIRTTLDAILAAKEMDNVRFDIEDVETLAVDPGSGKFRMVVRHTGSTAAAM